MCHTVILIDKAGMTENADFQVISYYVPSTLLVWPICLYRYLSYQIIAFISLVSIVTPVNKLL